MESILYGFAKANHLKEILNICMRSSYKQW
jgi:hypothetical protein